VTDRSATPRQKWNVGDEIIVEHAAFGRIGRTSARTTTETITRVARKYFYINKNEYGDEQAFEIETGIERPRNPNYRNYLAHAYTPEGWNEKKVRDHVLEQIREHKVTWGYTGTWNERDWSVDHLREFLKLLDRVKAGGESHE
jgi:hypothetical protein